MTSSALKDSKKQPNPSSAAQEAPAKNWPKVWNKSLQFLFLSNEEVVDIHAHLIEAFGGIDGLPDESALASAQKRQYYESADLATLAATYAYQSYWEAIISAIAYCFTRSSTRAFHNRDLEAMQIASLASDVTRGLRGNTSEGVTWKHVGRGQA